MALLAAVPTGCGGTVDDRNDRGSGGASGNGHDTGGASSGGLGSASETGGGSAGLVLDIPVDAGPGCAGVSSSSRTRDEVEAAIRAELEALNSCDTVDDCHGELPPYDCRYMWIDVAANRERLDGLLEEYREVDCDGIQICPEICMCGTLRCIEGRCDVEATSCMEPAADGVTVCM